MNYESVRMETKSKIIRAFWEFYKNTNIEKITVKNITDACGIYRTTFYLHFSDIYAILELIEEELLKELRAVSGEALRTEEERQERRNEIFAMLRKNSDYLRVLLDGRHHPAFAEAYKQELIRRISMGHSVDLEQCDEKTRRIAGHTLSAMVDLFFTLAEEEGLSEEELFGIVEGYLRKGILATLTGGKG
ncbi:MAG: hypothetical protein Q4F41_07395 [Eubacteriales bacterium]|nr:hypothetical protein [Eubacteriales bacterium]